MLGYLVPDIEYLECELPSILVKFSFLARRERLGRFPFLAALLFITSLVLFQCLCRVPTYLGLIG